MTKSFVLPALFWLLQGAPVEEQKSFLIYGGSDHDQFLGCLNCSKYSSDSVCNSYGTYGNRYSGKSLFNSYSTFGNSYSPSSPWNEYSTSKSVPVLVDKEGNFYGYFTINNYRSGAADVAKQLREVYKAVDGDLEKVQEALCGSM